MAGGQGGDASGLMLVSGVGYVVCRVVDMVGFMDDVLYNRRDNYTSKTSKNKEEESTAPGSCSKREGWYRPYLY